MLSGAAGAQHNLNRQSDWSQAWGSLGVSALLVLGPIRRVGIPALTRLYYTPMTTAEIVIGMSIFALFATTRTPILVKRVAPKVVERARNLDKTSPLHHRALAPLCGLGLLPLTARSISILGALPAIILAARAAYGLVPLPYRDVIFFSAMFGGLAPFAAAITAYQVLGLPGENA